MIDCLFVGLGGFVGAIARFLVGKIPFAEAHPGSFPINTFLTNLVGAFVIGLIAAMVFRNSSVNPRLVLFLKVGICGSFTTFSTFSLETEMLFKEGAVGMGILYIVASVIACIGAVFLAEALVRA